MQHVKSNVLITSAGRRGLLVQIFQRELKQVCPQARVLAVDLFPQMSSACQMADESFRLPRVTEPHYTDQLLQLCLDRSVGVVVPTIDTEIQVLADARDRFFKHGIHVIVSESNLVSDCRDKRRTIDLFARCGVASPKKVDPRSSTCFPLIAKPYDGSCSNNLQIVCDASELSARLLNDPKMVFFEYLSHDLHDEYTVDMYFDRHSKLKCLVPRLRIETRAGEISKGKTCRIEALESLKLKFGHLDGARGCLTAQFFVNKNSGDLFGIEINPRFGGGFPLSYEAGANYPRWILEEYLNGKEIEAYEDWTDQLTMLRYDAHVLVSGSAA